MTLFSSLYGAYLDEELGTDDVTVRFTTARRKSAINKGMREFAHLTDCCQRIANSTWASGTATIDLNSTTVIAGGDFAGFSKEDVELAYLDASSNLTILSGDQLVRRDIHWLNRYEPGWDNVSTQSTGTVQLPQYYYVQANGPQLLLGLVPQPLHGTNGLMVIHIPYLAQPAALSSNSQEPFTFNSSVRTDLRPYHQALVHYAASQLEKLRRDPQAVQSQLQQFLGYVTRYFTNLRVKGGRTISLGRTYFTKRESRADPRT